jgi:hypothetical protein
VRHWAATIALIAGTAALAGGCGLNVELADLFLVTRTGQGTKLTMLVNDSGAITCNGGKQKMLSSALLIQARDLSGDLANDATDHLDLPVKPGTVFSYKIEVQQGTIRFSDRDTLHHPLLAQMELFTAQAAQQACGLPG